MSSETAKQRLCMISLKIPMQWRQMSILTWASESFCINYIIWNEPNVFFADIQLPKGSTVSFIYQWKVTAWTSQRLPDQYVSFSTGVLQCWWGRRINLLTCWSEFTQAPLTLHEPRGPTRSIKSIWQYKDNGRNWNACKRLFPCTVIQKNLEALERIRQFYFSIISQGPVSSSE